MISPLILPLIVLGGAVTIVMLAIALYRNHRLTALLSVLGLDPLSHRDMAGERRGAAPRNAAVRNRPLCAFLHGADLRSRHRGPAVVLRLSRRAPRAAGGVLSARAGGDARRGRAGRQRSLRILLPRPGNAQHLAARLDRLSARPRKTAGGRRQIPDLGRYFFCVSVVRHGPDLRPAGLDGIRPDRGIAHDR